MNLDVKILHHSQSGFALDFVEGNSLSFLGDNESKHLTRFLACGKDCEVVHVGASTDPPLRTVEHPVIAISMRRCGYASSNIGTMIWFSEGKCPREGEVHDAWIPSANLFLTAAEKNRRSEQP